MSFDPRLEARWRTVIVPAVAEVSVEGKSLDAHRVDARSVSDSILTGDVTSLDNLNGVTLRNPNVFYEVGIAHAMRLPEEVLLFRSDDGPLLFDVANIRVNRYDPDGDPAKARAQVRGAVTASIREITLTRSLIVESCAARLDSQAFIALLLAAGAGHLLHPVVRTIGEAVHGHAREAAITSLLQLGLIETDYQTIGPDLLNTIKEDRAFERLLRYRITNLGRAVLQVCKGRLGSAPKPGQADSAQVAPGTVAT
jgi:hypothetical protein